MNRLSLISFVASTVYLFLGIYTFSVDRKSKLNRAFLAICLAATLWAFCCTFLFPAPDAESAMFWLRAGTPGWCLVPAFFAHFAFILTRRDMKWLNSWWKYALFYAPGVACVVRGMTGIMTVSTFVLAPWGWNGINDTGIWFWVFTIYYMVYVLSGIVLIARWGIRSSFPREKMQARAIVIAALITIILNFINESLLPSLGIMVFPKVPFLFLLIWAYGMWYAIFRLRLMSLTPAMATEGIMTKISDMMLLVDSGGRIIKTNRQVQHILGFQEDELLGEPFQIVLTEKVLPDDYLVHQEIGDITLRTRLFSKKGMLIPVQLSVSGVSDAHGMLLGFAVVAQDMRLTSQLQEEIGERKKMEDALRESYDKLKEMDRIKTDFLSTVSHELRTPLTSILGFTKIIANTMTRVILPNFVPPDEKAAKAIRQVSGNLQIVIDESERLTLLINELLDIAKLEAGKIEWKMEILQIDQVIAESLRATQPLFDQKQVKAISDVVPDLPSIIGDRDRIKQVMINLISNALKFTEVGSVTCRVRKEDDALRISVIDTGPGIPPDDLDRIFEKYIQGADDAVHRHQGTGLGLSICRQIVDHHGGLIWAENEPNQGASISFTLPL